MATVSAEGQTSASAPADTYPLRWRALWVILAAQVMDMLDSLVTSVAGPSIVRDLGGGQTLIQWLGAAYTIAMASGLLIGGRLGDVVGRRRVFLIGMAGFTAMSLTCALSPDAAMLLTSRVLQGLFGALMIPQGLGMIKEIFPPREAGTAFGALGPVMGLSAVAGPILAGWLIDLDLFGWSWRAIFAINVPVGILAGLAGLVLLPASRPARGSRVDLVGGAIASVAMVLLIYPLIQGRELGWPWWTYLLMVGGLGLFGAFGLIERFRERQGKSTLIAPSLFSKPAFIAGLATGLMLFGALMGCSVVFALLVQLGLGYSPFKAGLATLAQALGMIAGFVVSRPLNVRLGRRLMFLGEAMTAAGFGGFALTLHLAGDAIGISSMAPALGLLGVGMGLTMAPFFNIVLAGVDAREAGSASGALTSVQQLGGAFGVAVLGTTFFHFLSTSTAATHIGAFREATSTAMYLSAGLILAAFVLTFLLPRHAQNAPDQ
ncbi:MFS transporter [Streptomyces sp. NPDC001292]|uniref:MFS transporter n=1 Tax=Streptomyces sp. NPDC001292 TaxID=3364558 RepID=UPI0036AEAACD